MLATLLGSERQQLSTGSAAWWWPFESQPSASGITVTAESSLRASAVFACVRVLAETLASAPLILYQRVGENKERATGHPLYWLLHDTPNNWQTAFEFWEMAMGHLALRGNFYAQILPGRRGAVDQLVPLHPDRMEPQAQPGGRIRYKFTTDSGGFIYYTQDEIFHIRGMSSDGLKGLSIVSYARDSIGTAIAAETHGATFFRNSARPGVVLQTDLQLNDQAIAKTREQWERFHAGADKAHRTAVLQQGLKAVELGVTNRDSQFLETREFQVQDIARFFRVPPHLIQDLSRSTNNNIEHQSLEFVQYTMLPWFRRIEAAIARDLIVRQDTYFCEFLVDGLLRGDIKSRYDAFAVALNNGWMSPNEIRTRENMNGIGPDGDKFFIQLNMTTLDKAGQEQEEPAPAPAQEPEEDDMGEEMDETMSAAVAGIGELVADELRGLIRWEIDGLKRAAAKHDFLGAVDEFYRDHEPRIADKLRRGVRLLQQVGQAIDDADVVARRHCNESVNLVLEASGRATAETLKAELETLTAAWLDRAAIFSTEAYHAVA